MCLGFLKRTLSRNIKKIPTALKSPNAHIFFDNERGISQKDKETSLEISNTDAEKTIRECFQSPLVIEILFNFRLIAVQGSSNPSFVD